MFHIIIIIIIMTSFRVQEVNVLDLQYTKFHLSQTFGLRFEKCTFKAIPRDTWRPHQAKTPQICCYYEGDMHTIFETIVLNSDTTSSHLVLLICR